MAKIVGRFCRRVVAPKSVFDRRSFRWKKSGRAWVLVGCPRGRWNAKTDRCSVGTRAHEVLVRSTGRCSAGRVVKKGLAGTNYGVSKAELVRQTKPLLEEAFKADRFHTEEVIQRVLGREVFVWDSLSVRELTALRRGIMSTVLATRG